MKRIRRIQCYKIIEKDYKNPKFLQNRKWITRIQYSNFYKFLKGQKNPMLQIFEKDYKSPKFLQNLKWITIIQYSNIYKFKKKCQKNPMLQIFKTKITKS